MEFPGSKLQGDPTSRQNSIRWNWSNVTFFKLPCGHNWIRDGRDLPVAVSSRFGCPVDPPFPPGQHQHELQLKPTCPLIQAFRSTKIRRASVRAGRECEGDGDRWSGGLTSAEPGSRLFLTCLRPRPLTFIHQLEIIHARRRDALRYNVADVWAISEIPFHLVLTLKSTCMPGSRYLYGIG